MYMPLARKEKKMKTGDQQPDCFMSRMNEERQDNSSQ